jgi:hypothetical protein
MRTSTKLTLIAAAALVVASCGGSDDSVSPPQPLSTSTVVGPITGFGSVIVNGVKFDDSAAAVTMDGAVASRDRLRVGMVVQIRGRIHADGTGVAESIRYEDCAEGPITAMNRVQNTLTVMGQTVHVDDGTEFDGVTLRDMNSFAIGDLVEVSCLQDPANNRWRATRVERKGTFANGAAEVEVKGTVSNLNLAAGTCTVGGLAVNFGGIAAGDRPAGLANGMNVEVAGRSFANGTLTADRLRDRDRDRIQLVDGDGVQVEGYVADFVSISSFKINGQVVNAANATVRNGTAADIRNGVKVEAEGTIANGVLVAKALVLRLQTNVRVEAGVQAKGSDSVTLLGRAIKVSAETRITDRVASHQRPAAISFTDLKVTDRLEVMAYRDDAGSLVATQIDRTAADPLVVVKGPADAKTPTTGLTLAGFAVSTGPSTRYRDASGNLVDATSFYNAVQVPPAVPTIVHARGVVASLATNVVDSTRTSSTIGELEIAAHD